MPWEHVKEVLGHIPVELLVGLLILAFVAIVALFGWVAWLLKRIVDRFEKNVSRLFELRDSDQVALGQVAAAVAGIRAEHDFAQMLHRCPLEGLADKLEGCPLLQCHQEEGTRHGPGRRTTDVLKDGVVTLAAAIKAGEKGASDG